MKEIANWEIECNGDRCRDTERKTCKHYKQNAKQSWWGTLLIIQDNSCISWEKKNIKKEEEVK